MSAPSRRRGPDGAGWEAAAITAALVAAAAIAAAIVLAVVIGRHWAGLPGAGTRNPASILLQLATGRLTWPMQSWVVLAIEIAILVAIGIPIGIAASRWAAKRPRIDRAAQFMGRGRAIHDVTRAGAAAKAKRLGVQGPVGVLVGKAVGTGVDLVTSWEDVSVCIAGPRVGKSTTQVIPAIADAPGAVVTTSNKRDVVDATKAFRAARSQVWVFDPQGVADEQPTWWWNPLSYVDDEVKALELAKLFSFVGREAGEGRSPFFDGSGETLIAGLLLAAARAGRPFSQVYFWLTDVSDDEPVFLLEQSGDVKSAASIRQIIAAPEKQKGGIYGTAQQIMAFMINGDAMRWVEPSGDGDRRPEFKPAEFVRSNGTLYLLSMEGGASAAPVVTALTIAVTEAAESYAKTQPNGRLSTPLLLVLDEAANVCPWKNLPNLYSHYGSRGISIITILQSWSQGVEVWGREGMRKLWTAANAKLYLGGVDEEEFLSSLSQLVGEYELNSRSVTRSSSGTSSSYQGRHERILDIADLRSMPRGRGVLLYSGTPAILVRTIPWMEGPHAAELRGGAENRGHRIAQEALAVTP